MSALADVPLRLWKHRSDLRMTHDEARQEHKESEGDPHLKGERRRRARELARGRMLADVPQASVVVTNPTHYAVALRYDDGMAAPRIVAMGTDRRTYRFLKDTRLGRTIILETANMSDMADTVTHYVAERIIERERAIEGDWLIKRILREEGGRREEAKKAAEAVTVSAGVPAPRFDKRNLGWVIAALLGGILIGVVGLLAYAWMKVPG